MLFRSKDIETAVKPINGARDVVTAQTWGKGYLEIDIDREKAARYGLSVDDVQNEIEMALGGRVVTFTVEKRDRFPVRIRYARAHREDEESVKRLLISPGGMAAPKGIPKDAEARLVAAVKSAYDSKEYKDFMASRGFGVVWADPQGTTKFMADSDASLGAALKAVGLAK